MDAEYILFEEFLAARFKNVYGFCLPKSRRQTVLYDRPAITKIIFKIIGAGERDIRRCKDRHRAIVSRALILFEHRCQIAVLPLVWPTWPRPIGSEKVNQVCNLLGHDWCCEPQKTR